MSITDGGISSGYRSERAQLVDTDSRRGVQLARALREQADHWFGQAASTLPPGWALLATAGYADGLLSPGSDLDLLLLHPRKTSSAEVTEVGKNLWYPFWDGGIKISPAVHSLDSALKLASEDLVTATTLLRLRKLAGDERLAEQLASKALTNWQKRPRRWLADLALSVRDRHAKAGEVAFLLEPNVKEGRGGLRDVQAIEWALRTNADHVREGLIAPMSALNMQVQLLHDVRVELHRVTGRASDMLLLQEQDAVADRLGYGDADAMMSEVAEAARSIAWAGDRFWDHVEAAVVQPRRRGTRPVAVALGLMLADGALELTAGADVADPGIILRTAAAAAQLGVLPSAATLRRLAAEAPEMPSAWTDEQRDDFVSLMDSGAAMPAVVESLDQYGLFRRVLPEWQAVRSRPQRNAYHTYTVDRHLLVTVVNAGALVRTVRRPDLLLLGAFLHDIGKCGRGDHTLVGMELAADIAQRMGLPQADVDTLVCLVEYHLLLPETATRRDVFDPGTAESVAKAVGDVDTLALLRALTEADSRATGPSAWSSWKAGLIEDLVRATTDHLRGRAPAPSSGAPNDRHNQLLEAVRSDRGVQVRADEHTFTVATSDRRGLFAIITGVLAAHGIDVLAATVTTTDDAIAVDEFRFTRRVGGTPDWPKVQADLAAALAGRLDLEARIERRARLYRPAVPVFHVEHPQAQLLIDNETSADATIVEVRAPDAPALLFRLASVISRQGLDIRHAKVATLGHEVVDTFYVQDALAPESSKLSDEHCAELQAAINGLLLRDTRTVATTPAAT
jgi:[protein-PII] uridylyltransferase